MKKRYYVLEWNGLDDKIELYDFESDKTDIGEIYEELELHNYSTALIMNKKQLNNFFEAVKSFKKYIKGIGDF